MKKKRRTDKDKNINRLNLAFKNLFEKHEMKPLKPTNNKTKPKKKVIFLWFCCFSEIENLFVIFDPASENGVCIPKRHVLKEGRSKNLGEIVRVHQIFFAVSANDRESVTDSPCSSNLQGREFT